MTTSTSELRERIQAVLDDLVTNVLVNFRDSIPDDDDLTTAVDALEALIGEAYQRGWDDRTDAEIRAAHPAEVGGTDGGQSDG